MNIDYLKDKINNKLTKEYFQEVYKSYVNENYRSAIVFLNSVVLYDLYCKLEDMRDAHEDEKAKGILKAIKEKQQSNLYSSEWEKLLIERVANQTELLSVSEVSSLMRLRELRNQCAHPEISEHTSELYSPSRETTLATIVEVLQALLIKPPYFTNNVFNLLMAEIENKNNTNYNMFELEILIKNRYLNHMSESRQSKTFESLWKVVFKDKSERANHNRGINYCALLAYIKNCTFNYVEYMESRKNYFTIDSSYVRWLIDLWLTSLKLIMY
ncbi:hypothetical protein [Bacillus sp. JCM 19041]|uniref:hypothetical protein n=1 Tax=Bacillus sp. JCM 19041 TaxID=1460637 RepID=UPI0006D14B33